MKPRHVVVNASGYFFQATPKMRAAGIFSEPLGAEMVPAYVRARDLNAMWDAIRAGGETSPQVPATGTLGWLIDDLEASGEYADKGPRTWEELDAALATAADAFGRDAELAAITPKLCEKFYTGLRRHGRGRAAAYRQRLKRSPAGDADGRHAGKHYAAKTYKWFRYLFNYGIRMHPRLIDVNPTMAVRVQKPPPRRRTWTETQVVRAIGAGGKLGLEGAAVAIAISYDTSLRSGDIRALTMEQFDGESFWVEQQKTGEAIRVPLYPETIRFMRAYRRRLCVIPMGAALVIQTPTGRAYGRAHLARHVRSLLRHVGIPDDIQFRDLRRTASMERADAGATEAELADAGGWNISRSSNILDTYNPRSYARAKSAQDKRRRMKEQNKGRAKV